jgi:ubiquinone/menaquinone biosynthesis C-methylase UbiE
MKKTIEQTYWDSNFKNDKEFADKFFTAIGDKQSHSKVWFREWLKNSSIKFQNCLDVGCGPATEHFGFAEDNIDINYTGVDSSNYLCNLNRSKGVNMIEAHAHSIPTNDASYELVMSRHVLEHNPDFRPVLNEMIRCASKLAVHIFFLRPKEEEIIRYKEKENLYENTYNLHDINEFLSNHDKVLNFEWTRINKKEDIVFIWTK